MVPCCEGVHTRVHAPTHLFAVSAGSGERTKHSSQGKAIVIVAVPHDKIKKDVSLFPHRERVDDSVDTSAH